jgi:phosphoglucosamine mutase
MLAEEAMTRLPQVQRNLRVEDGAANAVVTALAGEIASVEAELGATGRVVVRPSGTEPLVRVMVEAPSDAVAEAAAARLIAAAEAISR